MVVQLAAATVDRQVKQLPADWSGRAATLLFTCMGKQLNKSNMTVQLAATTVDSTILEGQVKKRLCSSA
jgi:hypothetical protein